MKKIIFLIFILLFTYSFVYADDEMYIQGEDEYNRNVNDIITGDFSLNPVSIINTIKNMLIDEITTNKTLIVNIMIIASVSGILNVIQTSLGNGGSNEAAFFTCFTLTALSVSQLLSSVIGYGADVIGHLTDFVTKICPVITILLVSCGKVASASSFYPVLSSAIYIVSFVIDKFIVPLIYLSAILGIVNNISERVQLKKLNDLIKTFSKWILTGILTIFTGINAIYGFSVPVLDAVSLKALKFTVGSCVPVVGGLVSDTVETVLSSTKLMKNAVVTAGIISLITICFIPIIKLAVIIFTLKLSAAAAEPLTDKRIANMISDIVTPVTMVFSMVISTAMLFIISIAIIMGAT